MKVLLLGGTHFVGRHIAEAFLADGHSVATFTRGQSADPLPAEVTRFYGDRNNGVHSLQPLHNQNWDICIDVSGYTPLQVNSSALFLKDHVEQYLFISTCSVYQYAENSPLTEDSQLYQPASDDLTEVTRETYGPLKVTCENLVQNIYGERACIFRPQIVAGPFDHTGRHTWWIWRAAQGGDTIAPGDGNDFVQVIDAADQARFALTVAKKKLGGVFNLAGPRITWKQFIHDLEIKQPVWVPETMLKEAEVSFSQLPLYLPQSHPSSCYMNISSQKALQAGLLLTSPADTIRNTREWSLQQQYTEAISHQLEMELTARAKNL